MFDGPSALVRVLLRSVAVLLLVNELRGAALAVPVLYAMYDAGGALMAVWIGCCTLLGIGLSVAVPLFVANRLRAGPKPA